MAKGSQRKEEPAAGGVSGAARAALDLDPHARGPAAEPNAPEPTGEARPTLATAAVYLMFVTGLAGIALGLYFTVAQGGLLAGILFVVLGGAYALGGRALHRGDSWGWGAGMIAGAFFVLLGILLLPLAAITLALAVITVVLLYRVREFYGMVRFDAEAEERTKAALRAERTANPEGLHCPHCGGTALWIAPDGSAWCEACKTGIISVKPSV